jgi:MoaA/NifB/PqqE/SkfB family radical SAM enzyme
MIDKKYFCYEIFKNLAVWSHNDKIGYNPCSYFKGYIKVSDKIDIAEVWNSPEHQALKESIRNDIPVPGCENCYLAEAHGLESRRLSSKKLYENFHSDTNIDLTGPQGLDYSVGNLCNLKCVICGPKNSTQWIPDYQKIHPEKSIKQFQYQKLNQIKIESTEALNSVKTVHFHGGGEPLLSDSHVQLLEKIQQTQGLSQVRVFYNTNGTQRVSDKILKLWEQCKLIELYFSIDDVEDRFDYQRTGADWNRVVDNLKWYTDNMPHNHMFNINCVWGYLNLFYLDRLVEWHQDNFSCNRYGDPTHLIFQKAIGKYAINHVSQSLHDMLKLKFQNYPQLTELIATLAISEQSHAEFWKSIEQLDQVRNTQYSKVSSEWSKLIS